ncbi:MAG: hypothetical protein GWN58_19520 [Anaerolineae bacterium]|nr:hypothetical protein [Anaerolineae bacterium]
MAMPNHPPHYRARGTLEDVIALLYSVRERQKAVLILSFRGEGPEAMDSIFNEMRGQAREIRQALDIVQSNWCEIQALIDNGAEE